MFSPCRLFSCGTSKDGDSYLVEWNESEGAIKRTYSGFRKKSTEVVQFDTAQNHFLAAGEDSQIKFWDVDNLSMIASTEADGGLPVSLYYIFFLRFFFSFLVESLKCIHYLLQSLPRLRFNKEGNLLAVTTVDNGFKILANAEGLRALRAFGNRSFEAFRVQYEASPMKVIPLTQHHNETTTRARVRAHTRR